MTNEEIKNKAMFSAARITLSPHEWSWTQAEQEEMARYILDQSREIEELRKITILSDAMAIAAKAEYYEGLRIKDRITKDLEAELREVTSRDLNMEG